MAMRKVSLAARGRALYARYQARLKSLNAADFGDLLLEPINILKTNREILEEYQQRFRYMLVDEYQDTNVAQYLWLRLLAGKNRNLCVVGDDDQSIYGWRGAEVENILRFERDFPGAKVIRLERNYRSTPAILGAASGLIAANKARLGKTLWTERETDGEKVQVKGVWDAEEEARNVATEAENLQRQGDHYAAMAVLVRASFQMREFEDRFLALGIPYRVVGGPRFYERAEIRDALAYLRVVAQGDDDLAFERIVNKPKRGLGDAAIQALHHHARSRQMCRCWSRRAELAATDELSPKARAALRELRASFARWQAQIAHLPHVDLAEMVLDESGYTDMLKADKSPESAGRLENLKELVRSMESFESLAAFLEHVSLVMELEQNDSEDRLSLMTLHAAKGLEFETVFLPGWEEGLFPSQRTLDEKGMTGLEEERRLAYVGLTRAKTRAFVSFAANRRVHGLWQSALPSRFIAELPEAHIESVADQGFYGNYGGGFRDNQAGLARQARSTISAGSTYDSPGWRRAQAARAAAAQNSGRHSRTIIDAKATIVDDPAVHREIRRGRTRLPSEIRLWPHRRAGRAKAFGRFRKGGLQARDGRLRGADVSTPPLWKASVTVPKEQVRPISSALLQLAPPEPQAVLIAEDPFGPNATVEALYAEPPDADLLSRIWSARRWSC